MQRNGDIIPYIKGTHLRKKLDKIAEEILATGKITGNVNYLLTKLAKLYVQEYESYAAYKNIIGEVEMFKLELYRKMISVYEDQKEKENGSV